MLKSTWLFLKNLIKTSQSLNPRILAKMMEPIVTGEKRPNEDSESSSDVKKAKLETEDGERMLKRKVALLMMYSGSGYMGMQRNPGFKTIEEDLNLALVKAGCIPKEHHETPQKMGFQRAARTDKGVSAAGQVVSLKMWYNIPNLVLKINQNLPEQIRVLDIIRTTGNFNCKNACSHRTYSYLLPTYAFTPVEEMTTKSYRAPDSVIDHVNKILALYLGTHNFHNFTSGRKPDDPSAKRYIMSFQCSRPFLRDGIEFAIITIKGQSFMLHQIRKLIGLMIAIVRGQASEDAISSAYQYAKFDVPKAPGLGLMLEHVHYDRYNDKFGDDGIHQKIEWEPFQNTIEEFKQKYIYNDMMQKEKDENVMLTWLETLFCHRFRSLTDDEATSGQMEKTDTDRAQQLVWRVVKAGTLTGTAKNGTSKSVLSSNDKNESKNSDKDGVKTKDIKVDREEKFKNVSEMDKMVKKEGETKTGEECSIIESVGKCESDGLKPTNADVIEEEKAKQSSVGT